MSLIPRQECCEENSRIYWFIERTADSYNARSWQHETLVSERHLTKSNFYLQKPLNSDAKAKECPERGFVAVIQVTKINRVKNWGRYTLQFKAQNVNSRINVLFRNPKRLRTGRKIVKGIVCPCSHPAKSPGNHDNWIGMCACLSLCYQSKTFSLRFQKGVLSQLSLKKSGWCSR